MVQKVQLGSISLSRIIQGYWRLTSWAWSPAQLAHHMNECVARGVSSFDTAEIYGVGECEKQIGQALAWDPSLRKKIQLITKTGIIPQTDTRPFASYNTTYCHVLEACKNSLRRLQTDHVDLFLIHREDPCLDPWECARALQDLKAEGLILAYGVSNFDPWKFMALHQAAGETLVTNQIECNPCCFEHFDSGMIDLLSGLRIHPMIWSPLAGGKLFSAETEEYRRIRVVLQELAEKYMTTPAGVAYAWLLHHPVGALPICGSREISRLEEATNALELNLDHEDWYRIYTASGQKILR